MLKIAWDQVGKSYYVCSLKTIYNKLVDERWLATGQSLLYAAYFGVGAIAGNYWTGYFINRGMTIQAIFLMNAVIVLITAVMAWIFVKRMDSDHKRR